MIIADLFARNARNTGGVLQVGAVPQLGAFFFKSRRLPLPPHSSRKSSSAILYHFLSEGSTAASSVS